MRGPLGEAQANAIRRHATLSVDAKPAAWTLLWLRCNNHRSWLIGAGKGQG